MKIVVALISFSLVLSLLLGIYYLFIPGFRSSPDNPKIISVKIHLQNQCSVIDDAFIVEAPDLHKSSKFYGKVAIMRLPENAKVKLSISRAFPDFVYDGIPEQVQPEMVLVADCSVSPRLKSIFEEMRNRFGN